jgi:hypothetical protein
MGLVGAPGPRDGALDVGEHADGVLVQRAAGLGPLDAAPHAWTERLGPRRMDAPLNVVARSRTALW